MDTGAPAELSRYMNGVCKYKLLNKVEETRLAKLAKTGDLKARELLLNSNLRFVVQQANMFKAYASKSKYSIMDLIQEGNSGLVYALTKFNPEAGYRFTTYAVHWIRAKIMGFVIRMHSQVKIGTTCWERRLFFKMGRFNELLAEKDINKHAKAQRALARQLNTTVESIRYMENRFSWKDTSLEKPMRTCDDESEFELKELLTAPSVEDEIEQHLFKEKMSEAIEHAMEDLNDREKNIIEKRWLSDDGATLDNIAKGYGLSRERIRQIELKMFQKVRDFLENDDVGRDIIRNY